LNFRVGVGQDAVSLRGRGAYADGRYTLDLEGIEANGPRLVPWRLQAASRVTIAATDAALNPMCIAYEARRICLEGRWKSGGDWSAQATTEAFPLEALATKRLGAPHYRGLLVIDAKASAKAGSPWVADVRAEIRDGALDYKSASGADRTVSLGLTRLTLVSDATRHRVDLRVSDAADLDLAVGLEAARLPGKDLRDLPVTGSVRGKTRQLALLPLLVDTIDNASGELALDFSVAGRVAAPVLQGEAKLSQGTLDFYQTNLRLRDLDASVRLEETSLALDAKGKAGDGSLAVDGRLGWKDRKLAGALNLSGDRLLVANVPEARVFASPDLKFRLEDRAISVDGDVVIPEARIVPADTANAVLPSSDERIAEPEAGPAGQARPFQVTSDFRLSLGEKVQVKAYGFSATVTGAVRTRSSPRESTTGLRRARGQGRRIQGLRPRARGRARSPRLHGRPGHGPGRRPSRLARAARLQGRRHRARSAPQAAAHAVLGAEPAAGADRLHADRRPFQHPGRSRCGDLRPQHDRAGRRLPRGPVRQVRRPR
jgi:translocation and assembly module TamB